jgi:hypothetical protein
LRVFYHYQINHTAHFSTPSDFPGYISHRKPWVSTQFDWLTFKIKFNQKKKKKKQNKKKKKKKKRKTFSSVPSTNRVVVLVSTIT